MARIKDLSRLKSWLNTSGIQSTNNPLYQLIKELIGEVEVLQNSLASLSSGSAGTVINNPISYSILQSEDGIDGDIGPPGIQGIQGIQGIMGPPGLDGYNSENDFPTNIQNPDAALKSFANIFTASGNSFSEILGVAKGLQFPATQVASADPNVLDDFEEGSFTPVIGGSTSETGQTYSSQVGRYVKFGSWVGIAGYVVLSNKGTITGNVCIKGLPFPILNSNPFWPAGMIGWSLLATNIVDIRLECQFNTSRMNLYILTVAASSPVAAVDGNISNTSALEFAALYPTDN